MGNSEKDRILSNVKEAENEQTGLNQQPGEETFEASKSRRDGQTAVKFH